MADEEQVAILRSGVKFWNYWRRANPRTIPDLTNAQLNNVELVCADLVSANLTGAKLSRSYLVSAKLRDANLSQACLDKADLTHAFLTNADLTGASLYHTLLREARLINANLSHATLFSTTLFGADLRGSDFSSARIGWLSFANNDLGLVKGLNTVEIEGPIGIDIESIYRSNENLPLDFLKRAGVPENLMTYLPSLTNEPLSFDSCFISYSNKDLAFTNKLHRDLLAKGVRCWFAPEDLQIGDKIRDVIDASIQVHDRLLVVLSKNSIESQWVESEVEAALARERDQGYVALFPIRLDNSVLGINRGWAAFIKNTRHIGDFSDGDNSESYERALERLLRDLKKQIDNTIS